MPPVLSIFDFDQTLTKFHTFRVRRRPINSSTYDRNAHYQLAKIDAASQKKEKIENYLVHNDSQISAIAAYHNNPAYIAGFVSAILNLDLDFEETLVSQDTPRIALDVYTVKGQKYPFLISYIPETRDFSNTVQALQETGKNKQLSYLVQVLEEKKIISSAKIQIKFYDSVLKSYSQAINLPFISQSYNVDASAPHFKISKCLNKHVLKTLPDIPPTDEKKLLSSSLFLQIMSCPASKMIRGLLIIGGLAALGFFSMGTLGAGIGLGLGIGLCMGIGFFANYKKASHETESRAAIYENQPVLGG